MKWIQRRKRRLQKGSKGKMKTLLQGTSGFGEGASSNKTIQRRSLLWLHPCTLQQSCRESPNDITIKLLVLQESIDPLWLPSTPVILSHCWGTRGWFGPQPECWVGSLEASWQISWDVVCVRAGVRESRSWRHAPFGCRLTLRVRDEPAVDRV